MWLTVITRYWKPLAALLLAGTLFALGVSAGNHWSAARVLRVQLAQAKADADQKARALELTQVELTKQTKVLDDYDRAKAAPDPVSAGLAGRLRVLTIQGACPVLPVAGASGAAPAAGSPGSDDEAERVLGLSEAVFSACHRDAVRFQALINLEKARVAIPP